MRPFLLILFHFRIIASYPVGVEGTRTEEHLLDLHRKTELPKLTALRREWQEGQDIKVMLENDLKQSSDLTAAELVQKQLDVLKPQMDGVLLELKAMENLMKYSSPDNHFEIIEAIKVANEARKAAVVYAAALHSKANGYPGYHHEDEYAKLAQIKIAHAEQSLDAAKQKYMDVHIQKSTFQRWLEAVDHWTASLRFF